MTDWTRNAVGDVVCEHGTASDVHCCGCHSGFLFDVATCTCGDDDDGGEELNMAKQPKPKKVSYEFIPRNSIVGGPMYALLDELVREYHEDLHDARIALAWCTSWKPDVDGRVTLGKCKKASDLDRELAEYDFIIMLRRLWWQHPEVTYAQRRALLDHELCHGAVKHDASGEPVEDERGRVVYRTRKHDIEEFTAIIERHGCYTADLESAYAALRRSAASETFVPCETCRDDRPGWAAVVDDHGDRRVTRCGCWLAWVKRRDEARREIREEQLALPPTDDSDSAGAVC